jgi:methionyl-tRNA formyltransferase
VKLHGVLLLAANTTRSQAYAQAMAAHGMRIDNAVIFDREGSHQPGKPIPNPPKAILPNLFLPDLTIPLEQTCATVAKTVHRIAAESVNETAVLTIIEALAPKLVIYSGYGSQIVSRHLLELGPPLLHMHAGWLPDYRGSTTTYYSILNERHCGVSAILLATDIDTGPIVARRGYPNPPTGLDIDHLYDTAIRADLLVQVLSDWHKHERFEQVTSQDPESGHDYYVIHPVLKHLALLSLH